MQRIPRWILCSAIAGILGAAAQSGSAASASSQQAIDRLKSENRGAKVSVSPATGTARFVRLGPASSLRLGAAPTESSAKAAAFSDATATFVDRNAAAFGLRNGSSELALQRSETDRLGQTHLSYAQTHRGVPVFGASLKAHFDASGRLFVVNGTLVPDLDISTTPSRGARDAEEAAVAYVSRKGAAAGPGRLVIYREGLAQGVPGANRLAYEVVVSNGTTRDFVFVDAHTGKVIDKISGTPDATEPPRIRRARLRRRARPELPEHPVLGRGQRLPDRQRRGRQHDLRLPRRPTTCSPTRSAAIPTTARAPRWTRSSIGANSCPNASWNGIFISFCPGNDQR